MTEEKLKAIVANNIVTLRKRAGLTQLELSEVLNYSDKTISKWERGDALPDVFVLTQIANYFNVTCDNLLKEHVKEIKQKRKYSFRRFIVAFLSVCAVWLLATTVYVFCTMFNVLEEEIWLAFIVAMPISVLILFIFNSIWGRKRVDAILLSIFAWAMLLTLFLSIPLLNAYVFFVGIPVQIIIVLWFLLYKKPKTKN